VKKGRSIVMLWHENITPLTLSNDQTNIDNNNNNNNNTNNNDDDDVCDETIFNLANLLQQGELEARQSVMLLCGMEDCSKLSTDQCKYQF
jgi:hypothetical protein